MDAERVEKLLENYRLLQAHTQELLNRQAELVAQIQAELDKSKAYAKAQGK